MGLALGLGTYEATSAAVEEVAFMEEATSGYCYELINELDLLGMENVAEKWKNRISREFFWKRYWHIMILIWPFKPLFDWLLKRYDEKSKLTNR